MKRRLFCIDLSTGPYSWFVEKIVSLAANKVPSYVCVANVHMMVEASRDPEFAKVVNGAEVVTPDGMPLAKGISRAFGVKQERVAGMDLLPDLLRVSESKGLSVYFYGGTSEMLDATEKFIRTSYPRLKVVGLESPPFRKLTEAELDDAAARINGASANIVLVVLGCPKQERWMSQMKSRLNACMIGVGGALPVMIGAKKRAPMWMQRMSLEWLFRLAQEPARLGPRYFKTNFIFLKMVAAEQIRLWTELNPGGRKKWVEDSAYSE